MLVKPADTDPKHRSTGRSSGTERTKDPMQATDTASDTVIRIRAGDSVDQRVKQIARLLSASTSTSTTAATTVTLVNAEPSFQKLVSICELAKAQLLKDQDQGQGLYQYNKMDYTVSDTPPSKKTAAPATTKSGLPRAIDERSTPEYTVPTLAIKLSRRALTDLEGWTCQHVTSA